MLDVNDLHKAYRSATAGSSQTIFGGLDLHVTRGQIVALLGASGSGKTTLLNLLSGIDTPDSGRVQIEGFDMHAGDEPERTLFRRHHIGFVFQFFNLIPTLTVGENVALPMQLVGVDDRQIDTRIAWLLDQVGLPDKGARFPETLSGGEQQRTAVARALAHRPKLLLADEPTGNLDEATGRQVITLLTSLAREQATTMIIVTHSTLVADTADRVLYLRDGRLVDGP